MTIKKKIFISNTLMVLISLMTLLFITLGLMGVFKENYLLENNKKSQLDINVYEVQTELRNLINSMPDLSIIKEKLNKYDYQLYVNFNSKNIYSDFDRHEIGSIKHIENEEIDNNRSIVYFTDTETIVRINYLVAEGNYDIFAVHSSNKHQWHKLTKNQFEIFIGSFLFVGILSILVLLLISQIFTKQLVKHIMTPVNSLISGAKRIEEGDLETVIVYKGYEEFEKVCFTFNEMQTHLKNEQKKNATYEKSRTDMISGISHDLRTPLTSVKGYIKGLKDGIANTTQKQNQYLDIAYNKACDMDILLQRLFYFSKLETGNMPFFMVETDLSEFIEKFTETLINDINYKNINIIYNKPSDTHLVNIDKEQFKRVLSNLVENSMKYSKVDSLTLRFSIITKDNKEQILIEDNGVGIETEKLPRLFEQFYRGDESRSSKNNEGNGLGLYISKYIIEAHGGIIFAQNENGFKVTITLPSRKEKTYE